jgi:hypothetical protein
MTIRVLKAIPGTRHRVRHAAPYGLPEPLRDGDIVEVIEWDHGHYRVRLDDSSERMVFSGNVVTRPSTSVLSTSSAGVVCVIAHRIRRL